MKLTSIAGKSAFLREQLALWAKGYYIEVNSIYTTSEYNFSQIWHRKKKERKKSRLILQIT